MSNKKRSFRRIISLCLVLLLAGSLTPGVLAQDPVASDPFAQMWDALEYDDIITPPSAEISERNALDDPSLAEFYRLRLTRTQVKPTGTS